MTPLARRRTRVLFSLLSAMLAILLASQSTLAAVGWTSPTKASPSRSYNYGMALARTVSTTTSTPYLHHQYTYTSTEFPGVYYRRGNATVSSWGTQKRVNATGTYADLGAIAASSKFVHVAYQTIGSWTDYDPTASRSISVRTNTNHGSSTAWLTSKQLSVEDRVGRPAIAAAGAWAYLVYTDADLGHIVVARNNGVNANDVGWSAQAIGLTAALAPNNNGLDGTPVVAAYGSSVLVAWISEADGTLVGKISTDNGATWPDTATTLRTGSLWDVSATAASGRFGLAWADGSGIRTKLHRNGAWQAAKTVATFTSTGSWRAGYGTAIGLAGTGRVGVAWSACSRVDCTGSSSGTKGVSTRWRESTDNIASWKSAVTVASYTTSVNRRINDYPSVVFVSTPKRYITYNALTADFETSFYSLAELGTGNP